jgi:hypothetical protein
MPQPSQVTGLGWWGFRINCCVSLVHVLTVGNDWWHVVNLHVTKVHGNHSGNLGAQMNWITQFIVLETRSQFIILETRPQFIVLETRPRASPAQTLGLDCKLHGSTPGGKVAGKLGRCLTTS